MLGPGATRSCTPTAQQGLRRSLVAPLALQQCQGHSHFSSCRPASLPHRQHQCAPCQWPLSAATQACPSRSTVCKAAMTASASRPASEAMGDLQVSVALSAILDYALEFARASKTYEVSSWMLLLGILKLEGCTAAKTLKAMGLDDLYGAWHEVLWAMNVVDALEARPPVPEVGFADRAFCVLLGATRFAEWGGRSKVQSEDLLMALAAGGVLDGLFPDLKLTFTNVRKAVEKQAGGRYVLPDDGEEEEAVMAEEDNFL